jgi:hypothetical protein
VCESATGMPLTQQNLAAPNGCSKLIIPYENSLFGACEGRSGVSREHGFYFVGNRETATQISSSDRKTGFIGIEFSPHGAFPLFGIRMSETVEEKIFDSEMIFGRWGRETREILCNLQQVDQKLIFIQDAAQRPIKGGVSHTFAATAKAYFAYRSPFLGFRNLPDCELADSGNLDQLVQQEIFIAGFFDVLDNWNEPRPLFLPAQTTFAQDDQSWMGRRVEEFDEVSRIRRDHRKVMIERILPHHAICSTDEANVRY